MSIIQRIWYAFRPQDALVKSYLAIQQFNALKGKNRKARLVYDMRVNHIVCLCSVAPHTRDRGLDEAPLVRGDQVLIAFCYEDGTQEGASHA